MTDWEKDPPPALVIGNGYYVLAVCISEEGLHSRVLSKTMNPVNPLKIAASVALHLAGGSVKRAALITGVARATMYRWMGEEGLKKHIPLRVEIVPGEKQMFTVMEQQPSEGGEQVHPVDENVQ